MRDMEKFEGWDSYLFMKNLYLKQIYMKINNLTILFFVITYLWDNLEGDRIVVWWRWRPPLVLI